MKVKLKNSAAPRYRDLTAGNVYSVIGIEADDYRIMNDHGRPYVYPHQLFTLVDKAPRRSLAGNQGRRRRALRLPRATLQARLLRGLF